MKHLFKIIAATCLLGFSMNSQAQTVAIKFAKGSYCGSYSGNVAGKRFTLGLGAGQVLNVSTPESGMRVVVKDPKGRTLPLYDQHDETDVGGVLQNLYRTTTKGQYSISLLPAYQKRQTLVEFCAD